MARSYETLVAAAALANARTFGGEDYTGFHTLMALAPAFHMAGEMPAERGVAGPQGPLPQREPHPEPRVKVGEVLHPVTPASLPADRPGGEVLREAVRKHDMAAAEGTFAALARQPVAEAFSDLFVAVEDAHDVHRVVLPYRAWCLLDIVGPEHAHTLLRQSVRYCVREENPQSAQRHGAIRSLLPKAARPVPADGRGARQAAGRRRLGRCT